MKTEIKKKNEKYGYAFSGINLPVKPDVAAAELKYLKKQNKGKLTPTIIIEAAKSPDSVLHEIFEWDDKRAAMEHRMSQARYLIRCLDIIIRDEENKIIRRQRMFVNIQKDDSGELSLNPFSKGESYYDDIGSVLSDPEMKDYHLKRCANELQSFVNKYETLKEIQPLIGEIKKYIAKLRRS